jgi:hypothetical protein
MAFRRKEAAVQRVKHGASGFVLVAAIPEPAFPGQLFDVGEGVGVFRVNPGLNFADAGRVNDPRAAG